MHKTFRVILTVYVHVIGNTPYPGMDNKEVLNVVKRGYRLEKPVACSEEL